MRNFQDIVDEKRKRIEEEHKRALHDARMGCVASAWVAIDRLRDVAIKAVADAVDEVERETFR